MPGHGLGLSIARELARAHGGDVELVRSDGSWTEMRVRLPQVPNDRRVEWISDQRKLSPLSGPKGFRLRWRDGVSAIDWDPSHIFG